MFDWFSWWMGLFQGLVVYLIGTYILFKYILPKMGRATAKQTIQELKKDEQIAPMIKKADAMIRKGEEILRWMEPLFERFQNLDLNKIEKDIQPFIELGKKIDPKKIEELIDSVKELVDGFKKTVLKKPKVPNPD